MSRWLRYAALTSLMSGGVMVVGWLGLHGPDRRGVWLAAGLAWGVQLVAFAMLLARPPGTPGFLAAWAGGILLRFLTVGVAAVTVAGREDVGLLATLLTLVGLLLVLLLLEPLALGKPQENRTSNG